MALEFSIAVYIFFTSDATGFRCFRIFFFSFHSLNPIQDEGEGQKGFPTSFSPVTSTNVGIGP